MENKSIWFISSASFKLHKAYLCVCVWVTMSIFNLRQLIKTDTFNGNSKKKNVKQLFSPQARNSFYFNLWEFYDFSIFVMVLVYFSCDDVHFWLFLLLFYTNLNVMYRFTLHTNAHLLRGKTWLSKVYFVYVIGAAVYSAQRMTTKIGQKKVQQI